MIPALFGSVKSERSPVFTEQDIRKLVLSFPPPEPRPGRECLVRSLSGRNLIRSDAVIKRFNALLNSASGFIFLNSLHNELGIHDTQWILTQQDEQIYYTRDRQRLLSESIQRTIVQSVRDDLANGGIELDKVANEKDITLATLRRILTARDASLSLEDLENRHTYDMQFLEKLENDLLKTINGTQYIILSDAYPQVPLEWLELKTKSLLAAESNDAQGVVETTPAGLCFTPKTLAVQRESQLKQAQEAYIQEAANMLKERGYCEVTATARPEGLRRANDLDLVGAIREAFGGTSSTVTELSTKSQETANSFLIQQEALSTRIESLASKAADLATEKWRVRKTGEEVVFDATELLATDTATPTLSLAILESGDKDGQIQSSFETQRLKLQQETTDAFATALQTQLLAPLKLYTQGADTIADPTLSPRVLDFIHDWARKELVPSVLQHLKTANLIPNKPASRDLDRFAESAQAAKNLDDMHTAAAKLARKQKIELPSPSLLANRKQEILAQKVAGMKKMKRPSDLLQNVIWILLARDRQGLYVSSGKDTSRMIRLVVETDKEAGAKLEGWKEVIKQGKDTDVERTEMKELAAAAVSSSNEAEATATVEQSTV